MAETLVASALLILSFHLLLISFSRMLEKMEKRRSRRRNSH
ncbi:MAG: hypothetical protein QHH75_04895 [Bacillota bacterium]|jgi:hypothetical protein|nr:hypothetical protein [Bacillota bacterium]